ncbi:hypothetical protein AAULR_06224 [Lacticaseibacillus rhamnosus MTCC 5462]|nr:hypothetical protein AAULR_06224 [Lacticaseibacillus rhamnosus MTCC 5462]
MALQVNWTFQLVALLFMTTCLAGTTLVSSNKLMFLLLLASVSGIIGTINQWLLLPLIIVQIVIAFLLQTQKMPALWLDTVVFGQALLLQITLIYASLHFFNRTMLLDLALLYLPALIGLWANRFPKWTDLILLLVVAILGYVQQRINFIAIGGMFIIVTVINSRRPFKLPRYIYQFSPLIMTLLLYLARMHG